MLTQLVRATVAGLAVSASLAACSPKAQTTITAENAAAARAVGERLAAADRANETAHRMALAKLIRVSVQRSVERDRTMELALNVHNFTTKSVRRIDLGLIAQRTSGAIIATTELHCATCTLAAHATRTVVVTIPYTQFGDDTGRMREAVGAPHVFHTDVKEIKYADGSDAGFDD